MGIPRLALAGVGNALARHGPRRSSKARGGGETLSPVRGGAGSGRYKDIPSASSAEAQGLNGHTIDG